MFVKVGVAFPNASPLITERTDDCMIVLLLSGWFKSVAKIYNNCSFRMDRMSLGTLETKPSAMLPALQQFVNEPGETQEVGHDLKDKRVEDIQRGSSTRPVHGRGGGLQVINEGEHTTEPGEEVWLELLPGLGHSRVSALTGPDDWWITQPIRS